MESILRYMIKKGCRFFLKRYRVNKITWLHEHDNDYDMHATFPSYSYSNIYFIYS